MLNKKNSGEELYKLGILNMLVLVSHNIPEGFITFLSSYYDTSLGLKIALTIFIHNVTEGISIAVPIYYGTNSRKKALFVTLIASLSEPLGGLLSLILFKNYISDILISIILIGVATLMINLSIIKIYPEINKYKTKLSIILGTIIGSLFIILSMQ
jgi:ZIP family zinc transporter